jgi:hypothetical protein
VDLNRLTLGERLVGVGAAVLVFASFLHWLGGHIALTVPGNTRTLSHDEFVHPAWGFAVTAVAVVLGLWLLVYVTVVAFDPAILASVSPRSLARPVAVVGVVTFLLVLLKVVVGANVTAASFNIPNVGGLAIRASYTKTRELGAYVGLAASATIAAGAVLNLRDATTG